MKGIIIAAGMGKRLGALTRDLPKSLLKVGSTTLLENIVAQLRAVGISDIAIIIGYQEQQIRNKIKEARFFVNDNYPNNNILHSLMYAQDFMDDEVLLSYSDIWLEADPVLRLAQSQGDCIISVDSDWQASYVGRTDHPVSEAENVIYDNEQRAVRLGKHIQPDVLAINQHCGEFIGMAKISKAFCTTFKSIFADCQGRYAPTSPFQNAKNWHNAYLTDFFNEMIDRNYPVQCSLHQGGWREIDTQQDYERLCQHVMEAFHVV